jgi:hypothetical protein
MMKSLLIILFVILPGLVIAQEKDTLVVVNSSGEVVTPAGIQKDSTGKKDSASKRVFNPRQASIRSAIFPGLGQIYNKKYWKLPIVYTAIGIPVYFFFDNKTWYNRTRYALAVATSAAPTTDSINAVHKDLLPLVNDKQVQSLLRYRNEFRKNMDYSILFTLLFWGLNIVDATVDAHLKGFTVSDNLSMHLKPIAMPGGAGLSLVFSFNDNRSKSSIKY